MGNQFKLLLQIKFGVRDEPRYTPIIETFNQVPTGLKNQIAKELLLVGLQHSNILETLGIDIKQNTPPGKLQDNYINQNRNPHTNLNTNKQKENKQKPKLKKTGNFI